jgi:hypothetical protein
MKQWKGYVFESSSTRTEEFKKFDKDLKSFIKKELNDFTILKKSKGHFELFIFAENKTTKKIVYISISDVRFFQDSWLNNILIRTAKSDVDYTGGSNNYTSLENLNKTAISLTQ